MSKTQDPRNSYASMRIICTIIITAILIILKFPKFLVLKNKIKGKNQFDILILREEFNLIK